MMGWAHATTGAAAGAVTSGLSANPPVWAVSVLAGSILSDIDHPSATVTNMWGPVSRVPARALGPLVGGHRGATHHVLAAAAATAGVVIAAQHPVASAVVFTILAGVALAAGAAVVGRDVPPLVNAAVSAAVGWCAFTLGWPLLPVAVPAGLGVLVHLAGDRVPVGGTRERLVVAAAYVAVGVWLAWPVWGSVSGTLATG